ncbi:MAG: hypothetical protein A4E53_01717 [Pelotomaculum sp. PtaB.Bin104]|nr:MAG: hypothetical protein A4E53_01717 [Pelotomaculum sp. PtaB.Bin104]
MGEGMTIGQESIDTPAAGGETTSASNNEVKKPESVEAAQEAATQPSEDDTKFVSGSRKARVLGESRRKLAAVVIENAKNNAEGREQLKQLLAESPELDKYLQKHWKKDYEVIFKDRIEREYEEEQLEAEDKAKMRARAEILIEQLKEEKIEQAYDLAERLKFTGKEAEALKDLALKLEGQTIGDEELNYEEALKRAAYTIRPDKSRAGITSLPQGITMTEPQTQSVEKEVELDKLASLSKKYRGGKYQEVKDNLKIVEKGLRNGVFQLPMDE